MHTFLSFEDDMDPSLDLTPLIDTVFMLLIFFVMATTFSKPALEVALARAENAGSKDVAQERLIVTIAAEGDIFFNADKVAPEHFAARLETLSRDTLIIFNVDQQAPFGLFVQVLDAAKSLGRTDFIINASRPSGGKHDPAPADQ
jgi:biopolymer transport protein ExbD